MSTGLEKNISRSFQLVKESFAVLRQDKELVLFPILSLTIPFLLLFSFIFEAVMNLFGRTITNTYLLIITLLGLYLLLAFIINFFYAGLLACAKIRFDGGNPSFIDGIKIAAKRVGPILVWAVISATIGLGLSIISKRGKNPNESGFLARLLGFSWGLLTIFVLPVILFENKGIKQTIKRSAQLFKNTWGENVTAQFSMRIFFSLLFAIGCGAAALAVYLSRDVAILVLLALVVYAYVVFILSSTLYGIFVAALYSYANTGRIPPFYSAENIKHPFIKIQ